MFLAGRPPSSVAGAKAVPAEERSAPSFACQQVSAAHGREAPGQPPRFHPRHPLSGLFFEYSIGAYDLGLLDYILPGRLKTKTAKRRPAGELARDAWSFLKKAARLGAVEYVLYPALAGPLALKVLVGNVFANAVRNGWAYVVIYCGHFPEGTATFREEDLEGEDRAHWYARQVMGSGNFEIGPLGHVLSGHLGFQIEHHLFPNIPAWRYPEMAPRVRDICERHGITYNTGSLGSQFASAIRRLVRFALPRRSSRPAEVSGAGQRQEVLSAAHA